MPKPVNVSNKWDISMIREDDTTFKIQVDAMSKEFTAMGKPTTFRFGEITGLYELVKVLTDSDYKNITGVRI